MAIRSSATASPIRPGASAQLLAVYRNEIDRFADLARRVHRPFRDAACGIKLLEPIPSLRNLRHFDAAFRTTPRSIQRFLSGLPLTFQPGKAANLNAVYHFTFTGKEEKQATVTIRGGALQIQDGHRGEPDLHVTADGETWLGFLAKERTLLWALLRRRIRIKGSPKLLVAFGKCFPS